MPHTFKQHDAKGRQHHIHKMSEQNAHYYFAFELHLWRFSHSHSHSCSKWNTATQNGLLGFSRLLVQPFFTTIIIFFHLHFDHSFWFYVVFNLAFFLLPALYLYWQTRQQVFKTNRTHKHTTFKQTLILTQRGALKCNIYIKQKNPYVYIYTHIYVWLHHTNHIKDMVTVS